MRVTSLGGFGISTCARILIILSIMAGSTGQLEDECSLRENIVSLISGEGARNRSRLKIVETVSGEKWRCTRDAGARFGGILVVTRGAVLQSFI